MIFLLMRTIKKIRQHGLNIVAWLAFMRIKKKIFVMRYKKSTPTNSALAKSSGRFFSVTILGFGTYKFDLTDTPWHQDFTQSTPSPASWKSSFGLDCKPSLGSFNTQDHPVHDIKTAWELGRMHQLASIDNAEDIAAHISHFWEQNPFMCGVQWSNPMEVAIRALNMILAVEKYKNPNAFCSAWMSRFEQSMHEHKKMIESCLEVSTKPNNHYLSDLVGHWFIITHVFDITKNYRNLQQAWNELEHAFAYQQLDDGFFYEASTAYHRLNCELMHLAIMRANKYKIHISKTCKERYKKALDALAAAYYAPNKFVTIGDDDSGRITHFVSEGEYTRHTDTSVREFNSFGLSIIKTDTIHITLRHAKQHAHAPTGHKHNDALSLTLAINGMPIIIDPGSYLYTSHPGWRNMLRSWQSHSTPCAGMIDTFEPDIFQNNTTYIITPQSHNTSITTVITYDGMTAQKADYTISAEFLGITRTVCLKKDGSIKITDSGLIKESLLIFDPEVKATQVGSAEINVAIEQIGCHITFSKEIKITEKTASRVYGEKKSCSAIIIRSDQNYTSVYS